MDTRPVRAGLGTAALDKRMTTAHIVTIPTSDYGIYFNQRHVRLAAIPRCGEFIIVDDIEGRAQAFEVIAVFHAAVQYDATEGPRESVNEATVELRVKRVGTETDLFSKYGS